MMQALPRRQRFAPAVLKAAGPISPEAQIMATTAPVGLVLAVYAALILQKIMPVPITGTELKVQALLVLSTLPHLLRRTSPSVRRVV
jgi:hypothetical protein